LSSGGFPPARAKKRQLRNGRNASLGFPAHHPKSAKRARVLLNTPHSTGLVPTTLHQSGSLLREEQDRSEQRDCHSCSTNDNPSFSSLGKPAAHFSGRFRAACGGPLRLRLRRASLWSLRSKEYFLNLQVSFNQTPFAQRFAFSRPPIHPSALDTHPKESRAVFGVAPAPRSPFPKRLTIRPRWMFIVDPNSSPWYKSTVCQHTGGVLMPEKRAEPVRRKIHVDLPEVVHQKLRVKAALLDMSMQAFVTDVVNRAVADVVLPKIKNKRAH
jgi:hypothetical protein